MCYGIWAFSIFFNNNIIEQVEIYLTAFSFIREVILYKFTAGLTYLVKNVLTYMIIYNLFTQSIKINNNRFLLRMYPVDLVDKPLFSPSSFTLMMETASNNLLKEIITDDDGDELLVVTVDNGKLTPPKSMDTDDLKLVIAFISNINMQELLILLRTFLPT